ncbi:MAG: substrate-binding domain-containing protein [Chloroflexota bacterium]|nr:substrate-binding domain-containing protein [Chloroflexota bacterium]
MEVALQQRDAEGIWGERIRPQLRIIPAERTGVWLNSSPITVEIATAGEAASDDEGRTSDTFYCIVHHGHDGDPFWRLFNVFANFRADQHGLTNVEIHGKPLAREQAAQITDCAERGAFAIASTIPNPDALGDALRAARRSGVNLFTFNSGAGAAADVGAIAHYSLDEHATGEAAGAEFNAAGLTGTVLCLHHEPDNIGLRERCEGLSNAYQGEVKSLTLAAGALGDPAIAGPSIAGFVAEHRAEGILLLNAGLMPAALGVKQRVHPDLAIGMVGRNEAAYLLIDDGLLLFSLFDGESQQAAHIVMAFNNLERIHSQQGPPVYREPTTVMAMKPWVANQAHTDSFSDGWRDRYCRLLARRLPEFVPESCN